LLKLQRYEASLTKFDRLLLIEPNHLIAINERASVLSEMKKYDDAISGVEKALAIRPQYAEAHLNKGNILCALKRYPEAIDAYNRAIAQNPCLAEAYFGRGTIFYHLNLNDEAIADFERASAISPDYAEARFYSCFAELPILYKNQDEIVRRREAYERKLRALANEVGRGDLVRGATIRAPFYLAYQGYNDRDLQTLYGSLVCRIMARKYAAPRLPPPPARAEVIRVGIVSSFFCHHSNWKIPIKGWVSQLNRSRFHVTGYHLGAVRDEQTEVASRLCDRFVHRALDASSWREEILADAPHVLIYPGLFMDNICTELAAQRLAPVQCNSWGHPETSGMPTIDYFLSSDLMEPSEAAVHYSERLVRLPNLSVYYEPVQTDTSAPDRVRYGLRSDAVVFFCGQSLFKFLPQFDEVFPSIAKRVANCQFVFLRDPRAERINVLFQERLDQAFSLMGLNASDYCLLLPPQSQSQFISAIGLCDIFLDSIGWSGANTTLESLVHNLPIVTMPKTLMRSRHSAAILQMMEIGETIAHSVDEYVSIAARLANHSDERHAVSSKIAESKSRVYRDPAPIAALQDFLDNAVRGSS
jgi:predicted O-linked N-acetylglucosamine transferase (SPINDLY family)